MEKLLSAAFHPGLREQVPQLGVERELAASPRRVAQAAAACVWGVTESSRRLQGALLQGGAGAEVREHALCWSAGERAVLQGGSKHCVGGRAGARVPRPPARSGVAAVAVASGLAPAAHGRTARLQKPCSLN